MEITLDYRNPTPAHCNVAIFINGALTGILQLRQEEIGSFEQIITHGCCGKIDTCKSRGNPDWSKK